MAEAAVVGMIIEKLTRLVMEEISSIIVGFGELKSLRSELKEMQRLLENRFEKQLLLYNNWEEVEELVYEADDLVDEIMYDGCLKFQRKLNRRQKVGGAVDWVFVLGGVVEKVFAPFLPSSKLPKEVARLTQRIQLVNGSLLATANDDMKENENVEKSVADCGIEEDDFVAGREGAREELTSRLLDNEDGKQEGLRIVIILGIGGIGKTALAKNLVHKDGSVRSHFDCISWVTVGKDFRTRKVLEQMLLQHVFESRGDMIPFSDLDLAQMLYEFLQNKKYLIVLDDVWSTDAWDCLRIAFPSQETSASRVLLTIRDALIAEKIASSANNKGFVYQLRPLNPDESWELLSETPLGAHCHPEQASVEHPQKYCSQRPLNRQQKVCGSVEDGGFASGRVVEKLFAPFWPSSKLPKEVAHLIQQIRLFKGRLRGNANDDMKENGEKSVADCGIEEDLLVAEDDLDNDFVLDREDAREELISCLLDDDGKPGLRIVIINGIGGIGEKTLAKELLCKNCSICFHFDCIAWATVGRDFRTRNVLEQLMLQHLSQTRYEMTPFSDLDLAQKLYEFLQHKKYLIVLNDVWSTDAWDCLRIAFPPQETSASRVLLTTRDNLVAEKIASSASNKGFVHRMRPLNQDESWEILHKLTFRRAHYHPELADNVKHIVKRCQGLPLSIRLMAGSLASKHMVTNQTIDQGSKDTAKVKRIRLVNSWLEAADAAKQHQGQDAGSEDMFDDYEDDFWRSVPISGDEENLLVSDDVGDQDGFVVGREDTRKEVISHLLADDDDDGKEGLRIVSICGMGGMGKTTLAMTVYQDSSIRHHFDCIAWATVGKDFHTRNILEQLMLQHLCQTRDDMIPFSDLDLAQQLYEFLQPKKYLIVLDDICSSNAWDCLRLAFPLRETPASRVLLTTRDTVVAQKIASSANKAFIHQMRTLNQDEGWELFRRTAFRALYPPGSKVGVELLEIAKDIVKHCQGLPLAIRVMAGLLAPKPTLGDWKMVHKSMVFYQTINQGSRDTSKVDYVLALSYELLPHHLKPCFLYMAMFPEDAEIEAERLYLLWLAEGFITSKHRSSQFSMMDVAEQYLNELAIRSMVSVHREEFSTFRRIKSCKIHDLLRDICLLKAKEQNFFDFINFRHANDEGLGSASPFSTSRLCRLGLSIEDGCVVPYNWNTDKQMQSVLIESTSHDQQQFSSTCTLSDVKDLSKLRGLFLSGFNYKALRLPSVTGELFPCRFLSLRCLPQILSDLTNFKRLRVLVFSGFNFDVTRLPTGIEKLFRLRCLSIRDCNITHLPSTIGNLLNLETLDLGEVTWVRMIIPNVLQKLCRLRYLYLPRAFEVYEHDKLQLDGLMQLETLVNFDSRLCRVKDLHKLTKLQKLVASIDGNCDDLEEVINCINTSLNYLSFSSLVVRTHYLGNHFVFHKLFGCRRLHVLQIQGHIGKLPLRICESLTEISLSGSELVEDPMEKLEKLPNLWVLVLRNNAFLGKHMTCSGMGMPQLKYLTISNLQNLESLTVENEGMPKLSNLVLERCQNLKKLPKGISSLTSLQELTVAEMPPVFMDRVSEMREDFLNFKHPPVVKINWPRQRLKTGL